MKKHNIAATALILSAASISSLAAGTVRVQGGSSCGTWVSERGPYHKGWLLGYLSGIAMGSAIDILGDTDYDSIYLWMDKYCRDNPLKKISDGGSDLALELVRNKGIKGNSR
jgi:hypothetical protein